MDAEASSPKPMGAFRIFSDRSASDLEAFEWNPTMDLSSNFAVYFGFRGFTRTDPKLEGQLDLRRGVCALERGPAGLPHSTA